MSTSTSFVLLFLGLAVVQVTGHGYLIDPPERSSIWRIFPSGPINNDDNGINCGGFGVMKQLCSLYFNFPFYTIISISYLHTESVWFIQPGSMWRMRGRGKIKIIA